MKKLTTQQVYDKYPEKKFFQVFFTDEHVENFKAGFHEDKNGISFTPRLSDTIMYPYGLFSGSFPCGEIFPKWICEIYLSDDAEIYIDNEMKPLNCRLDRKVIDYDCFNKHAYSIMKCNKCTRSDLILYNAFYHPYDISENYRRRIRGIRANGTLLQFLKPELQTLEICKLAVQSRRSALKYVPPVFQAEVSNYLQGLLCDKQLYDDYYNSMSSDYTDETDDDDESKQ